MNRLKRKIKKEFALELRAKVNTVGRFGETGEQIQNVISVGMLSEVGMQKQLHTLWACVHSAASCCVSRL